MRENYLSGVRWEDEVGYSRAVKTDNIINISGTTATDEDGNIVGIDDPYLQTIQIIKNIEKALSHFDTDLSSIVRTRMYATDIARWEEFGKAHGEYFGDIKPATSMVEVSQLIDPKMLIEIEAVAIQEK